MEYDFFFKVVDLVLSQSHYGFSSIFSIREELLGDSLRLNPTMDSLLYLSKLVTIVTSTASLNPTMDSLLSAKAAKDVLNVASLNPTMDSLLSTQRVAECFYLLLCVSIPLWILFYLGLEGESLVGQTTMSQSHYGFSSINLYINQALSET